MAEAIEMRIDVTDPAALGEPAFVAMTVELPARTTEGSPVVCFAKPGGGYSKRYFTTDLPGPGNGIGSQAAWHARRGWVFVSVDHLGVGESSLHDGDRLDYLTVSAAAHAAERELLRRLAEGTVADAPAIVDPVVIGIGHSMGGCLTVVQQGRFHCYDGIGVLGFSPIHTQPMVPPGEPPIPALWRPRDALRSDPLVVLNAAQLRSQAELPSQSVDWVKLSAANWKRMAYAFYYDDIPPDVVARDMKRELSDLPPWASATLPTPVASSARTPGGVAPEAAANLAPVLVAVGERDVVPDPRGEPRAYLSSPSVDLFICPRMGHMHNFASTRELLWHRIHTWGDWVRARAVLTVRP